MRAYISLLLLYIWVGQTVAFIGHGISMYDPSCAFACRAAIASAPLACTDHSQHGGGHHGGSAATTPECRSQDTAFLTTLAYCMNSTCAPYSVPAWKMEKYWSDKTTGDITVLPKWTYRETMYQIKYPPTAYYQSKTELNTTSLVKESSWLSQKMTLEYFEYQETMHARYGIVLLVFGIGIPIIFTLLGYFPYMTKLSERINLYIQQSVIGSYHVRPLPYLLGNAPTIGQAICIAVFFILNLVFSSVNYYSTQPNTWFDGTWQEIMGYVSCRTGVLAFALAPLVFLFSGRNNFLLWVTNWSHSTFMLLHRWVARIFAIQVIVHSIVELALYADMGSLAEEQVQLYWIWGIIATLACSISLVASILVIRRWSYEVFLIVHVILAIFVLVGSWYHVEYLFEKRWGYEFWLYAAFAVWAFDRVLRVFRVAKMGIRHAEVTEISEDVVRIDVPGVRWSPLPGRHAYAYFPTLNKFRPWESHPFSIVPTMMLRGVPTSPGSQSPQTPSEDIVIEEKALATRVTALRTGSDPSLTTTSGVSFFVRKSTGMTKLLKAHNQLTTLLEGPYTNNSTSSILKCDRIVLIGGGIGVTGLLSYLNCHSNAKLYWSVKSSSEGIAQNLSQAFRDKETEVKVGERFDVDDLLAREIQIGWKKIGVVVCGPGGLCDEVRAKVTKLGRQSGTALELEVEAFSW